MSIPRALFDTNIFLAFLLSASRTGTAAEHLLNAAQARKFELLLPVQVIIELNMVTRSRPHIANRLSQHEIESFLNWLSEISAVLPLLDDIPPAICRDPEDDFLIAIGFIHGANFIVTRDRDLLTLDPLGELRIIDPVSFPRLLDETPGDE